MPTGDPDTRFRTAQLMLGVLQTTHQHADAKAGILAATQAALVTATVTWSGRSVHGWQRGGGAGLLAGLLLALFAVGLLVGAPALALALRPRVWRPAGPNVYSFRGLSTGPDVLPADPAAHALPDEAEERRELAEAVRFLAGVAVLKYRWLTVSLVGTALMAASSGLSLLLRPWLGTP
ncbi:Pycsar system effector family protein [Streptomyces sp. NPDC015232]|uniref:Pycsar system effector family protein n=1 Tax=unclassified Streptomyces TaxID=2593676 RepID=UPI0036FDB61B